MVDFNNETTVGTPATEVEKISILQRRYDLIEAYEDYKKKKFFGVEVSLSIVRARLISLFIEVQATLKRRIKAEKDCWSYDSIKKACLEETNEDKIIDVIFRINEELDEMRLTRVDVSTVYNKRNVEEENKVKGY